MPVPPDPPEQPRRRVQYVPIHCKSALNRVQGMPFKWSLNPYVGCAHSCHYCYARAYYVKADHGNADEDFETRILVKLNFADVLRRELARPGWAGEQVALGTSTDAYQPAEGRFRLTRRVLEALRDRRNPLGMVTKSPLVLRDADVLAELAETTHVRVFFTLTTLDPHLWRLLEPGTANPAKRLHVLRLLRQAGIPAGVLLAPILPGITDSFHSIDAVAAAAADHGAAFFGASALRLAPFVKEHYLRVVAEHFPDLLPRYQRAYPGTYAPRDYQAKLDDRVDRIRSRYGFKTDSMRRRELVPPGTRLTPSDRPTPAPQLTLPL
jgi:DNA repair photolyase